MHRNAAATAHHQSTNCGIPLRADTSRRVLALLGRLCSPPPVRGRAHALPGLLVAASDSTDGSPPCGGAPPRSSATAVGVSITRHIT